MSNITSKVAEIIPNALSILDGYHVLLQILIIVVAIGIFMMIIYFAVVLTVNIFMLTITAILAIILGSIEYIIAICLYWLLCLYDIYKEFKKRK
jgi:hypothetical protein